MNRSIAENAVGGRAGAERAVVNKAVTERAVTERAVTERAVTEKAGAERAVAESSITHRSSASSSDGSIRNELRRYIQYDSEIRKRNAETTVLRQKRKVSEDSIVSYIHSHGLKDMEVKLPDGMLTYREKEVAGSITPTFLKEVLVSFYSEQAKSTPSYAVRQAETLLQYIMRQRMASSKKVMSLKRTYRTAVEAKGDSE